MQNFWSGFGMDAYPSTAVEDDALLPYLTYELPTSSFNEGEVSQTVQIWFKTDSESIPNAKVTEISKAIGRGGIILHTDDGAVWMKRGTPFSISASAQSDKTLKLRQLNITLEYFT